MESAVSGLLRKAKKLDPSTNREEFVSLLEKAISLDPYLAEPYIFLGLFYFKEQEWDKAQAYLSEGLNLDCVTSNKMELAEQAYVALGKTYRKLNNKEKSLLCFRSLIGLYPDSLISIKLADQLYGKMNVNAQWLKYYSMGCEAFIKGQIDEAEGFFEESSRLNDIFPWTQYQMGLIYKQKGEIELASVTFLQAIEEERHYLFCNALAETCHELGRKDEERKCIAEALSLNNHYGASLIASIKEAIDQGDGERVDFITDIIKTQIPDSHYARQAEAIISGTPEPQAVAEIKVQESEDALLAYPADIISENSGGLKPEEAVKAVRGTPEESQILKKISISPIEIESQISEPDGTPSGKLKVEVSSEESGKIKLEISADTTPSGRLRKDGDSSGKIILEQSEDGSGRLVADISVSEGLKPKEGTPSGKLRKDIVYDSNGKLKIESPNEVGAKTRRDFLTEKPIIKPDAEFKVDNTGVVSSLLSIMQKVDVIISKKQTENKSLLPELKSELKQIIQSELQEIRKEQESTLLKMKEEVENITKQACRTIQNLESRFLEKLEMQSKEAPGTPKTKEVKAKQSETEEEVKAEAAEQQSLPLQEDSEDKGKKTKKKVEKPKKKK